MAGVWEVSIICIAIFLLWTNDKNVVQARLMCCGVQDEFEGDGEETGFSAEDLGDYIFDELDLLGRTDVRQRVVAATADGAIAAEIGNNPIEFITADNTATNPKLARLMGCKFKGCDAHKEALEVNEWIGPKIQKRDRDGELIPVTERRKVLNKVDKAMVALSSLKNASKLRRVNKLKGKRINGVRWAANLGALLREKALREDLPRADFDRKTKDLFLSPSEQADGDDLVHDLKKFEKANKALQGQGKTKDSPRLTVAQSRGMLDQLMKHFPGHNFTKINKNSNLVTHPVWEAAIVKIQNKMEDRLTAAEKAEVKMYLLPNAPPEEAPGHALGNEEFDIEKIISDQEKEVEARSKKSRYRATEHIFTTSVIVECLFSRAKMILEDRRKSMSPWHMELLLFLYSNRDLWDANTVNLCMREPFWSDDEMEQDDNDDQEEA